MTDLDTYTMRTISRARFARSALRWPRMVAWLSRPRIPWWTLALTFGAAVALCVYLERNGAVDRLRNANIAFANLALCALALATLWPHSLPTPKRIGAPRAAIVTRIAHHLLFVGYFCAFCHYVCSFALLADHDYLAFVRAHPLGVIVAIFSSLFVIILSVQCLSADSKVKSFAIKINGFILALFTIHQALLNYEAYLAHRGQPYPPDVKIALVTFSLCTVCLALYVSAMGRRARRAHFAARLAAFQQPR